MKTEKDYLKEMFIPIYGEALTDEEVNNILSGSGEETRLFKSFLDTLVKQKADLMPESPTDVEAQRAIEFAEWLQGGYYTEVGRNNNGLWLSREWFSVDYHKIPDSAYIATIELYKIFLDSHHL